MACCIAGKGLYICHTSYSNALAAENDDSCKISMGGVAPSRSKLYFPSFRLYCDSGLLFLGSRQERFSCFLWWKMSSLVPWHYVFVPFP